MVINSGPVLAHRTIDYSANSRQAAAIGLLPLSGEKSAQRARPGLALKTKR